MLCIAVLCFAVLGVLILKGNIIRALLLLIVFAVLLFVDVDYAGTYSLTAEKKAEKCPLKKWKM